MKNKKEMINRIKVVLAEKQINQTQLTEMIGKITGDTPPLNTVSRWCNNSAQPSLKKIRIVAKALDVDVRELIVPTKEK